VLVVVLKINKAVLVACKEFGLEGNREKLGIRPFPLNKI